MKKEIIYSVAEGILRVCLHIQLNLDISNTQGNENLFEITRLRAIECHSSKTHLAPKYLKNMSLFTSIRHILCLCQILTLLLNYSWTVTI